MSYYLLIILWEMLSGLCKAAELLLGVCCCQDSAEDTSTQDLAGQEGRRDGYKQDR